MTRTSPGHRDTVTSAKQNVEHPKETLARTLKANEDEQALNGYRKLQGNGLKEFRLQFGSDINVPTKTTVLGVFDGLKNRRRY